MLQKKTQNTTLQKPEDSPKKRKSISPFPTNNTLYKYSNQHDIRPKLAFYFSQCIYTPLQTS